MKNYTVFDALTKTIISIGICSDQDYEYQGREGVAVVEGHYLPETHYIDSNNVPRAKTGYLLSVSKFTITADGIDESVISNIPANTTVTVSNSSFEVNAGVFEVTSSEIAAIVVTFTNDYYLTSTVTINAV